MQRHFTAALICATLIGLAGCGSDDLTDQGRNDMESTTPGTDPTAVDASDLASTLAGRTFLSSDVDGQSLVAGTQIRLTFQRDSVSAAAGCNTLGYDATYDDDTLNASNGMQTEMGCSDELEAQDVWLSDFLRSQPTVVLDGVTLTVATPDIVVTLVDRVAADPDRPLVGTTWVVDGLLTRDAVSSVPAGSAASITIDDRAAAVHTGCNRGNAAVEITDETITFAPMATTRMACEPALMDLEFAVTGVLDGTVDFSIEAGRLTITKQLPDGETIGLTLTAE